MSINYYIIGSGGFAKEVYFLAQNVLPVSHQFMGFIDYKPSSSFIRVRGSDVNILDEDFFLNNIKPAENIALYCGIGNPKTIAKLSILFQNYIFPNLIHKNFVGDRSSIEMGRGNIITSGCTFTVDIRIGSFNVFNLHTTIGHDVQIYNCNIFNPGCNISGDVQIGSNNLFGTNSTVLQGLEIGDNSVLGAASLATKNIEDNVVVIGIPAKKLEK